MAAAGEAETTTPPFDPARIEVLLKTINTDQKNILTTLGLMLDGFASQTALLKEMASLAKDDPGPSPLADSLESINPSLSRIRPAWPRYSSQILSASNVRAVARCARATYGTASVPGGAWTKSVRHRR